MFVLFLFSIFFFGKFCFISKNLEKSGCLFGLILIAGKVLTDGLIKYSLNMTHPGLGTVLVRLFFFFS